MHVIDAHNEGCFFRTLLFFFRAPLCMRCKMFTAVNIFADHIQTHENAYKCTQKHTKVCKHTGKLIPVHTHVHERKHKRLSTTAAHRKEDLYGKNVHVN